MGKRFEDVQRPALTELLEAYRRFGLVEMLGVAGENTALMLSGHSERLEVQCVPGNWSAAEFHELRHAAGLA